MTTKHTPGPWMIQGQWATSRGTAECIEAQGWGIIGAWIDKSNEPEDNARLIAAAPELLDQLKHALRFWDQLTMADAERYRAAIAKAEGRK